MKHDFKCVLLLLTFLNSHMANSETLPLVDYRWNISPYPSLFPVPADGYFYEPQEACNAYILFAKKMWNFDYIFQYYEFAQDPAPPHLTCTYKNTYYPDNGFYQGSFGANFIRYSIKLNGSSSTEALPSLTGPVMQTISIKRKNGDGIAMDFAVSISGANSTEVVNWFLGETNAQGYAEMLFVPPRFSAAKFNLVAKCSPSFKCESEDSKFIEVSATELSPLMCEK